MATTSADRHRPGPIRTCIGCRQRTTADRLVRCTLGADGRASVVRSAPGRGAWVCSPECVRRAARRGGFDRAWRRRVPAGALDGLEASVAAVAPAVVRPAPGEHERLTTRVKG